jgi:hypothetical protein
MIEELIICTTNVPEKLPPKHGELNPSKIFVAISDDFLRFFAQSTLNTEL